VGGRARGQLGDVLARRRVDDEDLVIRLVADEAREGDLGAVR